MTEFEDHPHIHGEYEQQLTMAQAAGGSPPHTWGIQKRNMAVAERMRITPTYMGNTRIV